jgi:hypothetical protein
VPGFGGFETWFGKQATHNLAGQTTKSARPAAAPTGTVFSNPAVA